MKYVIHVPTIDSIKEWLFVSLIFFIPFTKLSIPAIGLYELTIGDLILVILTALQLRTKVSIRRSYAPFVYTLLLFALAALASIVMVRDFQRYFLSIIPFLFAIMIVFVTISFFSKDTSLKTWRLIRKVLIISLVLSALPVYHQFFTGVKSLLFYDTYGWRYTFLAQNPNQFGVYFILYFFLITLIAVKYFPKDLGFLLLVELLFFIPAFYSGSKSTTLVFSANYLLLLGIYFLRGSIRDRAYVFALSIILGVFAIRPVLDYARSTGAQLGRALQVFDMITSDDGPKIGGHSGRTIQEAKYLAKKYPVLGVGLGNKVAYTGTKTEIHNTFLLFLAETGIVGFSTFILFFLLPLAYAISSRDRWDFKLTICVVYVLFILQNIPHMLLRQRWVWLFICVSFILTTLDRKGEYQRSRLRILNQGIGL